MNKDVRLTDKGGGKKFPKGTKYHNYIDRQYNGKLK